jgi:hypothetical protein
MGKLGSQAKLHGEVLQAAGPPHSQGGGSGRRRRPELQPGALLPCVLPKAAMDRAAHLLLLEADLRGHPELRLLLGNLAGAASGQQGDMQQHARIVMISGNGSGEEERQQLPQLGRHNQQHQLWQQLLRTIGASSNGQQRDGEAAAPATAEQEAEAQQATQQQQQEQRHRHSRKRPQGRSLAGEERLVLGILSDPRFGFAAKTELP